MPEDLDDHRQIFDACPERVEGAAMIFKAPPQFGQYSMGHPFYFLTVCLLGFFPFSCP
jgi:hypothetical protein